MHYEFPDTVGNYDTIPFLARCELVRPNNADFVTVIRYRWNGKVREIATVMRQVVLWSIWLPEVGCKEWNPL